MESSAKTPEMRRNLKPIQDLFNCCGATSATKETFIADGICTKAQETLVGFVWSLFCNFYCVFMKNKDHISDDQVLRD